MSGELAAWLPTQRWFGAKGREIVAVQETVVATLSVDPEIRLMLLDVSFAQGRPETYQLLVGSRPELDERLAHARIGDDGLYDAAHDPVAAGLLLQHLASGKAIEGLDFQNRAELDTDLAPHVLGVEQSNTSIVYGDALILKLFRRLQPGANPDIEVTLALADAGSPHVAPPLAWIDGTVEGQTTTLGLLQPFLRGASEGWAMATASVRDLLAEGDLRADEVGGDFAGEAERLGVATGEVHQLLAQVLPSGVAGVEESRRTAEQMLSRLEAALEVVPSLAEQADALRQAYREVGDFTGEVPVQRVHGDLHLGQVLRTQDGWVLLDFEGEPARPHEERRALMSPLRDVAGMLRSFDYAARHLLVGRPPEQQTSFRAAEWAERNRSAFCDGYARALGADPREQQVLLRAFELDKAVYEVVYEARNRPTWLEVPLGSVARLVGEAA